MKTKSIFIFLLLLMSFSVSALDKLTVMLDWFPNPNHAPLFVAQQQGFFQKQGLDVTFVGPANTTDPTKLVAAGKADVAITYQPQLYLDVHQGLPLVRIGTLVKSPLGCLLVPKESAIHDLSDLKTKTIGYAVAGVDTVMLNAMLSSAHLMQKEVKTINVNYGLVQALMAHRVDAVVGVERNFEMIEMQLEGFPVTAFYPEAHGIPPYDEFIFVTHRDEVSDVRLPRFLKAVQQGEAYLQKNPQKAWQVFAQNHPELNNELNRRAWFYTLPYFAQDPAALDRDRYIKFAYFLRQQGFISQVLPLERYAVALKMSSTQ